MTTILALDTTSAHCAVALVSGATTRATKTEPMTKGQAERLFPMTDEVLEEAALTYKDLTAIAVATGPGNFTGVRICVSAARGLALSLNIPAIGVSTLEALAYGHMGTVLATLDARADHLYAQIFDDADMPHHDPVHIAKADLPAIVPAIDHCCGYLAQELAAQTGARGFTTALPPPETYARIAMTRDWTDAPRPSPLYLRAADAALPTEPIPHIIR